jgi:hypothetical protein
MTGTRLNDCTPTPNEQAKYVISDAEREAQIRRNHSLAEFKNGWGENKTGHKDGFVYDHWKEKDDLLHLLDKARAEATVAREQLRKTCAKILGADTDWPQHDNVSFAIAVALHLRVTAIREARSEIARLIEEAAQLCDSLWVGTKGKSVIAPKIRALAADTQE